MFNWIRDTDRNIHIVSVNVRGHRHTIIFDDHRLGDAIKRIVDEGKDDRYPMDIEDARYMAIYVLDCVTGRVVDEELFEGGDCDAI